MTIPPNIQKDIDQLNQDIANRVKALNKQKTEHESFVSVVLPKLDSIKDPALAMAYVAYVFQTLGSNGSILGVMEDGIGVLGTNLSDSGDLNLIQSDYQSFMNQQLQEAHPPP